MVYKLFDEYYTRVQYKKLKFLLINTLCYFINV